MLASRLPFPNFNVKRRSGPVTIDTRNSNAPALDNGSTCVNIFVGTKTLITEIYGMETGNQFINALDDNISKRGAMDNLISDSSQSLISNRVKHMLRALFVDDFKSEPH